MDDFGRHTPAPDPAATFVSRAGDEVGDLDAAARREVRGYFERTAERGARARERHRSYYDDLFAFVRSEVTPGVSVLDLGCGDGALLASLEPSFGVGVDVSVPALKEARARFPDLHLVCADVERLPIRGPFDFVIVNNVIGYLFDVERFMLGLADVMHAETRVLVVYYNFAWEPLLHLAAFAGLRARQPLQNWLSSRDLRNIAELSGLRPLAGGYRTPIPVGPSRLVRRLNGALERLPVLRHLGLVSFLSAVPGPTPAPKEPPGPSVTVVIPSRNERGNIREAVRRLPQMGRHTEVIFVEGHSSDGTAQEIEAVIGAHPELDLKLAIQDGTGKGDAVRKGFAMASGDVLMILDADLTVPPEDLPKFYDALVQGRGDFISGSRLVYPMEGNAMRLANMAGNKAFGVIFSWILRERVTDTLCGTKVLWAKDYRRIEENRALFGEFDPFGDFDLLFGAANLGLRIREVPVRYRERRYGTTNIDRWRHGLLLARMALIGARKLRFG